MYFKGYERAAREYDFQEGERLDEDEEDTRSSLDKYNEEQEAKAEKEGKI